MTVSILVYIKATDLSAKDMVVVDPSSYDTSMIEEITQITKDNINWLELKLFGNGFIQVKSTDIVPVIRFRS